jgi:membrane protein implicated in regulation of membrane protease activity
MTWSDFYLFCFIVGFAFSVLSFLASAGHFHFPARMHLPFHAAHHSGAGTAHGHVKGGTHFSWFNAMTIMTFLAWFGGVGYLLTEHSALVALLALSISAISGVFAATLVFRFMAKIVQATDTRMLDWDYRIEGSIGTVTAQIRQNGIGEVTFEQNGVRKSLSAKTEDQQALSRGSEVVISRYDSGIAYVKRWEEFTK